MIYHLLDSGPISTLLRTDGIKGLDLLLNENSAVFIADGVIEEVLGRDVEFTELTERQRIFSKWLKRNHNRVFTYRAQLTNADWQRFNPSGKEGQLGDVSTKKMIDALADTGNQLNIVSDDNDLIKYPEGYEGPANLTSSKSTLGFLADERKKGNISLQKFRILKSKILQSGRLGSISPEYHSEIGISVGDRKVDNSTLDTAFKKMRQGEITAGEFIRIRKRYKAHLERSNRPLPKDKASRNLLDIPEDRIHKIAPAKGEEKRSSANELANRFKDAQNSDGAKKIKQKIKSKKKSGSIIVNSLTHGLVGAIVTGFAIQHDMSMAQAAEALGLDDHEAILEAMAKEAATEAALAGTTTVATWWTGPLAPIIGGASTIVRQGYKLFQAGEDVSALIELMDVLINDLDHELIAKKTEKMLRDGLEAYDPLAPSPTPFFGVPYILPFEDRLKPEIEKEGGKAQLKAEAPKLNVIPASVRVAKASRVSVQPASPDQALRGQIDKLHAEVDTLRRKVPKTSLRLVHKALPRPKPKKPTANLGLAFNHLQSANNRHG